jgi:hypothetical protein
MTSGAAPDAVKAARPVLNREDEETGRKVLRLVLTQRECAVAFSCGHDEKLLRYTKLATSEL